MHMYLEAQNPSRLLMRFKYYKEEEGELTLVCEGTQATASMREEEGQMIPVSFPESMLEVFESYEIL